MLMNNGICFFIFVTCSYAFENSNETEDNVISNVDNNAYNMVTDRPDLAANVAESNISKNQSPNSIENKESNAIENDESNVIENEGSNAIENEESKTMENDELGSFATENEGHLLAELEPPLTSEVFTPRWLHGKIPFYLDKDIYDEILLNRIIEASIAIETSSCVVFYDLPEIPNTNVLGPLKQSWLHITNPGKERECVHGIRYGKLGEVVMIIGFDCMEIQDIIHSFLHVLGFNDEVTHPQRNSYVRILWHNIQPKYRHLFKIQDPILPINNLTEYDTTSIMHFYQRAYTINGAPTIVSAVPGLIINPSESLSMLDKRKLSLAYRKECNQRDLSNLLKACKKCLPDRVTPIKVMGYDDSTHRSIVSDDDEATS